MSFIRYLGIGVFLCGFCSKHGRLFVLEKAFCSGMGLSLQLTALIFTGESAILKKWWTYLLLYLPDGITLYVFALSNGMAPAQYNLVKTNLGWTNIQVNNGWDMFFNVYYAGFTLGGLAILWYWGRKSSNIQDKSRQI